MLGFDEWCPGGAVSYLLHQCNKGYYFMTEMEGSPAQGVILTIPVGFCTWK
jgi:hypothetical protein